jgi:hypothetical protein
MIYFNTDIGSRPAENMSYPKQYESFFIRALLVFTIVF